MFGFRGGESDDTVARKKGYMKDAKEHWPFLTTFSLSNVKTEGQLVALVKTAKSLSLEDAKRQVQSWMHGKQF